MAEKIMAVPYLELDKETKGIKMQVLHTLGTILLMVVKGWVEISRQLGVAGSPPKVKEAQEAGPKIAEQWLGEKKLCLKSQPDFRVLKRREM